MQVCGYVSAAASAGRVLGTRVCVSGALLVLDLLGIGTLHLAGMAFLGVAGVVGVGGAGSALWQFRPKDPRFEVVSIDLSGFHLRWETKGVIPFAVVDVAMTIKIKVTNPNITPIKYTSTTMQMFYRGSLMGTAEVKVNSAIKVDPVFLKVLDQENRVEMELAAVPEFESKIAEQGETHAQTAEEGETRAQTAEQGETLAQTTEQ